MVNGALQVCGFVTALLGWILSIVTCAIPSWRKSDQQGEVIESVYRTTGLWSACTHQTTGIYACDSYDSFFLGLPVSLQAARALTCLSMAVGFFGAILCIMGLNCTNVSTDNPKLKSRMVIVSAILNMIGGIAIGIAVSWFASNILREYQNQVLLGSTLAATKYVYGEALFLGWVSMVLSIIGGLVQCCSSWNVDDDDSGRGHYAYNPPKPKHSSAEYI